MRIEGTRAIVTGAAGGIGAALARALHQRGASVLLADLSPTVTATAEAVGGSAWIGDVATVAGIDDLIAVADDRLGGVDIFFANAGIGGPAALGERDEDWEDILAVNLRAHVRAARALIPRWQAAGSGYFVATASAAGLLTQIGSAAYAVTKHASLGFAEWLAVTYRDDGIRASVIAPMGVETDLLRSIGGSGTGAAAGAAQRAVTEAGRVIDPAEVATIALDAVVAEEFLILPHPEVMEMYRMKASDYDRWLAGMSRFQRRLRTDPQSPTEDTEKEREHAGDD